MKGFEWFFIYMKADPGVFLTLPENLNKRQRR